VGERVWHDLGEAETCACDVCNRHRATCDLLRVALTEAADLAEEGWAYAGDYFNEKWNAPKRIAELRKLVTP
jgi:hypothetical protein